MGFIVERKRTQKFDNAEYDIIAEANFAWVTEEGVLTIFKDNTRKIQVAFYPSGEWSTLRRDGDVVRYIEGKAYGPLTTEMFSEDRDS